MVEPSVESCLLSRGSTNRDVRKRPPSSVGEKEDAEIVQVVWVRLLYLVLPRFWQSAGWRLAKLQWWVLLREDYFIGRREALFA